MVVKTEFSRSDFVTILADYDLGEFQGFEPIVQGTVQTNYLLETTRGKFVLRYYESRSRESASFETAVMGYLRRHGFPCPTPYRDRHGRTVCTYQGKPLAIFAFVEGQHVERLDEDQRRQLVKRVADLNRLTRHYRPPNKEHRWNYGVELCGRLAREEARNLNTVAASAKVEWLEGELSRLRLPPSLPKGICHCDLHFTNLLYRDGELVALLDFDDANYTYLTFDLVGLIEAAAWHHDRDALLNLGEARRVVLEYEGHRPLSHNERRHLFDVYKLSILFDCIWYFERGDADDFREKRKVDYLNDLGRDKFYAEMFG